MINQTIYKSNWFLSGQPRINHCTVAADIWSVFCQFLELTGSYQTISRKLMRGGDVFMKNRDIHQKVLGNGAWFYFLVMC